MDWGSSFTLGWLPATSYPDPPNIDVKRERKKSILPQAQLRFPGVFPVLKQGESLYRSSAWTASPWMGLWAIFKKMVVSIKSCILLWKHVYSSLEESGSYQALAKEIWCPVEWCLPKLARWGPGGEGVGLKESRFKTRTFPNCFLPQKKSPSWPETPSLPEGSGGGTSSFSGNSLPC